jgi:hypothetical protein
MSDDFNPFTVFAPSSPAQAAREAMERDRNIREAGTRAALGHQAGRVWLQERLAEADARPSYRPGFTFDQVAYEEGRKAALREIAAELFPPTQAS